MYFFIFFKELNSAKDTDDEHVEPSFPNVDLEHDLNNDITEEEIINAIQKLKNGKATGIDNVSHQYLKYSASLLVPVFTKLFNLVFDSGIIPDTWLTDISYQYIKIKAISSAQKIIDRLHY